MTWSIQPRVMAASSPSEPPMRNASSVVAKAIPIVLRAPYSRRV